MDHARGRLARFVALCTTNDNSLPGGWGLLTHNPAVSDTLLLALPQRGRPLPLCGMRASTWRGTRRVWAS